jgi:hypothetical protein
MQKHQALELLPKFIRLTGYFSPSYRAAVKIIIVRPLSWVIPRAESKDEFKDNEWTLVAVLENEKQIPLRTLIEADRISSSFPDARILT